MFRMLPSRYVVPLIRVVYLRQILLKGDGLNLNRTTIISSILIICISYFSIRQYGWTVQSGVFVIYSGTVAIICSHDLERNLIPNMLVWPSCILAILLFPWSPIGQEWSLEAAFIRSILGCITGFCMILPAYFCSKGGLGAGDVKLSAFLGGLMGFPGIVIGLSCGFIIGGLIAVGLVLICKKPLTSNMPYGPSLSGGVWGVMVVLSMI